MPLGLPGLVAGRGVVSCVGAHVTCHMFVVTTPCCTAELATHAYVPCLGVMHTGVPFDRPFVLADPLLGLTARKQLVQMSHEPPAVLVRHGG
jgi:hypothetical protein